MKNLWRLQDFLRPYWRQVSLGLFLLLTQTAISMIIPEIIRRVIDVGLVSGDATYMINAALVILGIGVVRAFLPYGVRYLSEWVAAHIGYDLRNKLYNHIQYLPFTYHDHSQAGQLISRCIEDVRSIERFTGFVVIELIRVGLLMLGITILLLAENTYLAVISLLPLIPMLLITSRFGRKVSNYFLKVDNSLGELSTRLQENATGVQVVRAFAREPYEIERFEKANRILYKAQVAVVNAFSRIMPTTNLLVTTGTILILWFGGNQVLRGEITVGELVAFNSYLLMLSGPVQQLAWLVNAAGEAVAGVQRSFEILDTVPTIANPPEAVQLPALKGEVEFRNVCFHYEGERAHALEDINLVVNPNQIVALIGPTGSGKTSLVNLIPRFYDTSEGSVLVDGVDVRQVDLVTLRRQIGIVLQTSLLFSVTVGENIAYGRPQASQEEIEAAARAAQAHDFILELQDGYNTAIGERGVTLSGGQRQRIAIARALLMDPRILILDDSTSSVDTQTERLIQKALDQLMQGRTTFVIAHRLSTVRRADMILVMDHGRIVESGNHQELLLKDGLYRQIYELQLRDQENFREEMDILRLETETEESQFPVRRSREMG
jgi:ATP-binding cassette subfamily B multidrug efflux pump